MPVIEKATERRRLYGASFNLTFDIGELLADKTVRYPEYIDPSDMPSFAVHIHPSVCPTHNTPLTQPKDLLDLNMGLGRRVEKILPKASDYFPPRVDRAIGGGISVFEDTIVAHELHHACNIMTVEGLIEAQNDVHH